MRSAAFQRTVFFLVALLFAGPAAAASDCKLALVLALDVSGSVDSNEYKLQSSGLAQAFRDQAIADAIRFPGNRGIAATVIQWSGDPHQHQVIPWTFLSSDESILNFAHRVERAKRRFRPYSTAIGNALTFASLMFQANPFDCDRNVIDVSGDGPNNEGEDVEPARDRAVSTGITVNGLAILGPRQFLTDYYRASVIGGNGSFVITANTFKDYPEAIRKKLLREIQPPIVMLEQSGPTVRE